MSKAKARRDLVPNAVLQFAQKCGQYCDKRLDSRELRSVTSSSSSHRFPLRFCVVSVWGQVQGHSLARRFTVETAVEASELAVGSSCGSGGFGRSVWPAVPLSGCHWRWTSGLWRHTSFCILLGSLKPRRQSVICHGGAQSSPCTEVCPVCGHGLPAVDSES